ncbi:MAG: ABC transporter substrate-binding protein [Actinomycetia bacterium]|nr:ABC transporter substrate-binding protein [Actinomycetes bacterium]
MKSHSRLTALVLGLLLALAACSGSSDDDAEGATEAGAAEGSDESADDTATDEADESEPADSETADDELAAEFPRVVATPTGDVAIEARPERIVSLSATATEMLFAIGAGEQVEAVDSFSNYPAEAPTTDLSAFEANLEAVAVHDPDLVILGWPNDEVEAGLTQIGVPVLVLAAAVSIDGTYEQVAILGEATGNIDAAADTNASIRAGIDEILARVSVTDEPVRVYHELDDTFFSASSASYIGQLYELLGYENIADAADTDGFGYPQLQVDQIIDSDPTLIVYTDAYDYDATDIAARPGWDVLSAVSNGNIVEVNDDISSRWGPRVVDFLELIVEAMVPAS